MTRLVIGTTNEAKVKQIKGALATSGFEVEGLPTDVELPIVIENGVTAEENARKKALAYSRFLKQAVLSMDNALYIDGLSPEKQPGINVRRIPGFSARPTDDEMLRYYSDLIGSVGEQVNGHWEFAVCIAKPDGTIAETVINSKRIFVAKPCAKMVNGYPLESIQIEPQTGKYIADMSQSEQDEFWQKTIGKELSAFVYKHFHI